MARPKKVRKVCCHPDSNRFGPLGGAQDKAQPIMMRLDEYETIRLIDLEGWEQKACAEQMGISRTTVQGIYGSARKKLAEALVQGRVLFIEGGDYQLCDGKARGCGLGTCRRCKDKTRKMSQENRIIREEE